MRRLFAIALLAVAVVGCQPKPEEKLDLNKDTSDAASKIMSGQKVDAKDVMPKAGK